MPDLPGLLSFVVASILLSIAPGPDNIFVLILSATAGIKKGLAVTLGLCTSLMVLQHSKSDAILNSRVIYPSKAL